MRIRRALPLANPFLPLGGRQEVKLMCILEGFRFKMCFYIKD